MKRGPRGGYSEAERASLPARAFLKPETRSWPVSDLRHAEIALQYMSRGFGNRAEYGMLLHRLFSLYPPGKYPKLAEMYERLRPGIEEKAGERLAHANPHSRSVQALYAAEDKAKRPIPAVSGEDREARAQATARRMASRYSSRRKAGEMANLHSHDYAVGSNNWLFWRRVSYLIKKSGSVPMARSNPLARENWVNVAIQAGMAALPYVVSAFKKLSAQKLAQYNKLVATGDVEGQIQFIKRHSLMSPPVRVALTNDRAAEWLRVNLNEALAQGAGEAALAVTGAAADLGGAAASVKYGAKMNPRQRPGLYLVYTPSGALLEGHPGIVEHHFLEEYPDGSNFYGYMIYRIDWPRTAKGLLRAVSWIFGGSGALVSDHLLYGVRPDGKEFELSIEDIERLARMRPDDAKTDIKARANPRARVYHIQPKPNMVAAQLEAQELGNILVGRGLATKAYASWSDERGGRYNFRTVKLALVGLPVERVQWGMSNDQYIRRAIDAHIGEVIGAYAGEARANSRTRRKKKTAPSRRSEVHRQHIEKTPKSGAQGSKKGKKGYRRKPKHAARENPQMKLYRWDLGLANTKGGYPSLSIFSDHRDGSGPYGVTIMSSPESGRGRKGFPSFKSALAYAREQLPGTSIEVYERKKGKNTRSSY